MNPKILHSELKFRTSRSSGAGGQHVNKVETRVELLFDIEASRSLATEQKQRLMHRLAGRVTKEGLLIISSSGSRSQVRNRIDALEKFDQLIAQALRPAPKRKPVKVLQSDREKRLQLKKRHAEKKALRRKVYF